MAAAHAEGLGYAGVAVLVPCYNEDRTVGAVTRDFPRALPGCTVYVYDNNSSDCTAAAAQAAGAVVRREPRQGKGSVVRQMLRDVDADCYLLVDGDDTYPAESAPALVGPVLEGRADHVIGDRLSNGTYGAENKRAFHGFGNKLVRSLIKVLYGFDCADVMTGSRAMSREFAKTLPVLSGGFEIETELSIHAVDKRWRIEQVSVEYRDRPVGSVSKLDTFSDGAKVLRMIASLFKDCRPLPFFVTLAAVIAAAGLALGVPVCLEFEATGMVERLPTAILACALYGLAALMLVCGLVLDTEVKATRREWGLRAIEEFVRSREGRTPASQGPPPPANPMPTAKGPGIHVTTRRLERNVRDEDQKPTSQAHKGSGNGRRRGSGSDGNGRGARRRDRRLPRPADGHVGCGGRRRDRRRRVGVLGKEQRLPKRPALGR